MPWRVNPRAAALAVAGVLVASFTGVNAQRSGTASVALDPDDIGGVVSSAKGAEAGVWVIAETATDRRVDDRVPSYTSPAGTAWVVLSSGRICCDKHTTAPAPRVRGSRSSA